MGAGDSFCGEFDCGFDAPLPTYGEPAEYAAAYRFNPQTRDFDRDDDGRLVPLHWVDAAMQNALHFQAGKIGSAPTQGNRLLEIKHFLGPRGAAEVNDAVRQAVAWLVNGKHVEIVRVAYETPDRHASAVLVEYLNLRLDPKSVQRIRLRP
jgi:hypothetical protein